MRAVKLVALACVAVIGLCAQPGRAEPLKIRADWSVLPGQFAPLIPSVPRYAPDVYRHYGKSYVVEPMKLKGGGATLTALAVGDTDLSTFSPQTLVDGVVNAKLDLRVIAEQISTEVPGYHITHFWVHKDKIRTIDDLKGKVFAVNALGSNVDAAARIVMGRHGLAPPRDYSVVEVAFPSQLAALRAGKIDVAVLVPPFDFGAEADSSLKPIFSVGDAFGPVETLMWVAKAEFVKKNRAALIDFLEDNIRMRHWMLDPKTRMDAARQLSDISKIPLDRLASWVYTDKDYYYPPDAATDVKRLQKNITDMAKVGVIPKAIEVAPYVDLSLVEAAAARVKP
ncbi:MAG: ABC transporter substrate-binding protein [Stellaceae bacterium]